ncbi:MAG: ribose 5-phosphate isomerase B [Bacteroidota bacterium]
MEKTRNIVIGSDHAGYKYKKKMSELLEKSGYTVTDFGCFSEESVDYPDFAHPVAAAVEKGKNAVGILICGSGNGVCMTANKHKKIRAALCWTVETTKLSRLHNNANIVCLPARFIDFELAMEIVNTFLNTSFEGGRHTNRVKKIPC